MNPRYSHLGTDSREEEIANDIHERAVRLQHDLIPCPFCGAVGYRELHIIQLPPPWNAWRVECQECGAGGPKCEYPEEARDSWNARQNFDALRSALFPQPQQQPVAA